MSATEEIRRPKSVSPDGARKIAATIREKVRTDPAAALREAQRLHEEGTREKQAANSARRRSAKALYRFQIFKRDLEAMGIEVILEQGPIHRAMNNHNHLRPQGGASGYDSRTQESN